MIDDVRPGSPRLAPLEVVAWIAGTVVALTFVWLGLRPSVAPSASATLRGEPH